MSESTGKDNFPLPPARRYLNAAKSSHQIIPVINLQRQYNATSTLNRIARARPATKDSCLIKLPVTANVSVSLSLFYLLQKRHRNIVSPLLKPQTSL